MIKIHSELLRYKTDGPGNNISGVYQIHHPRIKDYWFRVIVSDGLGWDHVSVVLHERVNNRMTNVKRTPTWGEMSYIKDLFFDPEEWVMQFHPAHSQYVNNHKYCLHLWRWQLDGIPKPSIEMVGADVADKPGYVV